MMNNQTIDGVPRLRELLERVADPYRREPRSIHLHNSDIAELRALLDAPAVNTGYAPSEPSGARMEMSDEWTQEVFSKRMLRKLAHSAGKGRGGWQNCSQESLSRMLREHVEKGDPVDVANFCMFLDALGYGIMPCAQPQGEPVGMLLIDEYFDNREVGEVDVQLDSKVCECLARDYPGQSLLLYTQQP